VGNPIGMWEIFLVVAVLALFWLFMKAMRRSQDAVKSATERTGWSDLSVLPGLRLPAA